MAINQQHHQGFTLIEVLVAVLILAFGLLGLAGMQASALSGNLSSYYRSQAAQLAYDISDRMRANAAAIDSYLSANKLPSAATCRNFSNSKCADCSSSSNTCTSANLVEKDLYDWNQALTNILPGAQGTIAVSGDLYSVTIVWDENKDGAIDSSDPSFAMRFRVS